MSKVLKNRNLSERPANRALLAISLAASMAAFGCTTDRNVGNGDPVVTPGLRTSPTGGSSAGSESGSVPPPMMSSYSGQALSAVRPRVARMSAAEAAALLAEQQQPRVRVLGPASPANGGRPYVSDRAGSTGQPAAPYSTINSSIYSAPTSGISSGAGDGITTADDFLASLGDVGATVAAGTTATGSTIAGSSITGAATVTGSSTAAAPTILGTTVTNAGGAVIAPTSAATVSPTAQSMAAPHAFASVRTLSPTAASVVNPPASISSSPTLATLSSVRTAGTATRTSAVTTTGTTATTATPAATTQAVIATGSVSNPVHVMTTNGRVTVTNVNASGSRQQ